MGLKELQLFNEVFQNLMVWAPSKIEEYEESAGMQAVLDGSLLEHLSPKQQYEYGSYYWCNKLVGAFEKFNYIRTIMSRNPYRRKGEDIGATLNDWIVYNYEHYTIVYQGILDLVLILTNEILDLGNPYKKCSYSTVCENTKVNGTGLHNALEKIKKVTSRHREGKNLLVHRGGRIKLPLKKERIDFLELTSMAIKTGVDLGIDNQKKLLLEFLAKLNRTELLSIMEKECKKIELHVEELFNELLPYYRRMRSFYS